MIGAGFCFARQVIALKGRVYPELERKPQCHARLVRDMSLRVLVPFGHSAEATVGVFVVPKKSGKQMLFFDTQRVNQHFSLTMALRVAYSSSWAGLQLPAGAAYDIAQTDVNTAFCRILDWMSEYFVLKGSQRNCVCNRRWRCQSTCSTYPSCRLNSRFSSRAYKGW